MPRKKLVRTSEFPYHIVTRSNHKWWFNMPMERVWHIFLESLILANKKHPITFHGAVCMGNHYHMVLTTPDSNIDQFMFVFNSNFSRRIREFSGEINRMLGKRYHWTIVNKETYYQIVMKYIFRNPVHAGICSNVEVYPFSSLYYQVNNLVFPVKIDTFFDFSTKPVLEWLNEGFSSDQRSSVKTGLKKAEFKPGARSGTRNPPHIDIILNKSRVAPL